MNNSECTLKPAYAWTAALASMLLVYMPVALSQFMAVDDYWLEMIAQFDTPELHANLFIGVGRLLTAASLWFFALALKKYLALGLGEPQDFIQMMRIFSVLIMVPTFKILWDWFDKLLADRLKSYAIVLSFMLLPGIALYACWGVIALWVVGMVTVALAMTRISLDAHGLFADKKSLLYSAGLLFLTFHWHQGLAFIYLLAPFACCVLTTREKWQNYRTVAARYLLVFFNTLLFYVVTQKYVVLKIFEGQPWVGADSKKFVDKPFGSALKQMLDNFYGFFDFPFWRAANLWNISDSRYAAVVVLWIVFAGIAIWLFKNIFARQQGATVLPIKENLNYIAQKISSAFIFCSLTLTIPIGFMLVPHYRVLVSFSSCLLVLLIFSLYSIAQSLPTAIVARCSSRAWFFPVLYPLIPLGLICVLVQHQTLKYYPGVQTRELAFLKSGLSRLFRGEVDVAYVVAAGFNDPTLCVAGTIAGDEFSMPSFSHFHHAKANMLYKAAKEFGLTNSPPVTLGYRLLQIGPFTVNTKDLVVRIERTGSSGAKDSTRADLIDLNWYIAANSTPASLNALYVESVETSSQMKNLGGDSLLQSGQRTAPWHTQSPPVYPEWVTLHFSKPIRFSRVILFPQIDLHDRAPGAFEILVSNDGKEWKEVLSAKATLEAYKTGTASFELGRAVECRHVKMLIHGNCGHPNLLTLRGIQLPTEN